MDSVTIRFATPLAARLAFWRAASRPGGPEGARLALALLAQQPEVADGDLLDWLEGAQLAAEADAANDSPGPGAIPFGRPDGAWRWGTGATYVEWHPGTRTVTVGVQPAEGRPAHYDPTASVAARLAGARGHAIPDETDYRAGVALAETWRSARRAEDARRQRVERAAEEERIAAARRGWTVEEYRRRLAREEERSAAKRRHRGARSARSV